jgi:hypothetical protein
MKIIFAFPPGRFPTVVNDPGVLWDRLSSREGLDCTYFDGNVAWWRKFCSPGFVESLSIKFPLQEIISGKLTGKFTPVSLAKISVLAGEALTSLQDKHTFTSVERYAKTLEPLSNYVRLMNYLQPEFSVSFNSGPEVNILDYSSSSEMIEYAGKESLLYGSIEGTLISLPQKVDVCFLSITSQYDLLTSLVLAKSLRRRYPGIYLSIISHGYENFSLESKETELNKTGAIFRSIDSIIKFNYQKNDVVPYLVRELESGRRPKGFIERTGLQLASESPATGFPRFEVFSPEPLFWMRLRDMKCYWNRCVFCVQNAKHEADGTPSETDIDRTLLRIEKLLESGYNYFYFCDEAVSPRLLEYLCAAIIKKKMVLKWACRCRIEAAYTEELFGRLKEAGCYEVLFGVESLVPRVQELMRKYQFAVKEHDVKSVIDSAARTGVGIHLTFIVGFPGERLEDAKVTLMFLSKALKHIKRATYYINNFTLFTQSAVFKSPEEYGITPGSVNGDMEISCAYAFCDESMADEDTRLQDALPELLNHVEVELGWAKFDEKHETKLLRELYFNYGHGAYLKSMEPDIFAHIPD